MADIFVSFKTDDTARVQLIYNAFQALGFSVFWSNDIPKGALDYQAVIKEELLKAPAVIVVWTNASVKSGPVVQECSQAELDNKLFQILLEDIQPIDMPMEVRFKAQKTLLLDWTGDVNHREWVKLIDAIHLRVGRKSAAVTAPVNITKQTPAVPAPPEAHHAVKQQHIPGQATKVRSASAGAASAGSAPVGHLPSQNSPESLSSAVIVPRTAAASGQIKELFTISGIGRIAGVKVTDGRFRLGMLAEITRHGSHVGDAKIASLHKDRAPVATVVTGDFCGIRLHPDVDIKVGDNLQGRFLSPQVTGRAEVVAVYRVASIGRVAGCRVVEGKVFASSPVRIVSANGQRVRRDTIMSLKINADFVAEVSLGQEFGLVLENDNTYEIGDTLETI